MVGVLVIINSGDEVEESVVVIGFVCGGEFDVLLMTYDVAKIRAYWSRRLAVIVKCLGSLFVDVMGWVLVLLFDI